MTDADRNDSAPTRDVLVIGPGAIGCAFGAALAEAGHRVRFAGRLAFNRLSVTHPAGSIDRLAVMASPDEVGPIDLALLATKAHQIAGAAHWLQALPDGCLLGVLQNGLHHESRVRPFLGDGVEVVPAMVACPATRHAPGEVEIRGKALLDVSDSASGIRFAAAFAGSFATVQTVADLHTSLWRKLMLNAIGGGIGTLARRGNALFVDDLDAQALARALAAEFLAVAQADGANLNAADVDRLIAHLQRGTTHRASIVVDRVAGRATEWQARNEVVVTTAERYGIDVALHRMLTTLIRLGEPT